MNSFFQEPITSWYVQMEVEIPLFSVCFPRHVQCHIYLYAFSFPDQIQHCYREWVTKSRQDPLLEDSNGSSDLKRSFVGIFFLTTLKSFGWTTLTFSFRPLCIETNKS